MNEKTLEQINLEVDEDFKIPKWIWIIVFIIILVFLSKWYPESSSNRICNENHENVVSITSGFLSVDCFVFKGKTIVYKYKFRSNGWGLIK